MSRVRRPKVRLARPDQGPGGLFAFQVRLDFTWTEVYAKDEAGAVREFCLLRNRDVRRKLKPHQRAYLPVQFVANPDGTITDNRVRRQR